MATPQLAPGRPQPAPVVTNAAGAATMAALYTEALKALPFPYECLWVETSFDRTHVVVAGPADAPPVVVFHGTASPGPFQLAGVGAELVKHCRLYVPDIPGQGGSRSDNALLDPALHRHGTWAGEVVAALGLLGPGDARPPLGIGISLGAAVLLDLAVTCPQAVRGAALIAPVCLYPGTGAGKWMPASVALGFLLYRLIPCRLTARFALSRFSDDPNIDDPVLRHVLLGFRYLQYTPEPPGPFTDEQLRDVAIPVLVACGERDVFGAGEPTVARARSVFRDCITAVQPGANHLPRDQVWGTLAYKWMVERGLLPPP